MMMVRHPRDDELIGRFELETYEATCKEIEWR
jgi:hypothetical protein